MPQVFALLSHRWPWLFLDLNLCVACVRIKSDGSTFPLRDSNGDLRPLATFGLRQLGVCRRERFCRWEILQEYSEPFAFVRTRHPKLSSPLVQTQTTISPQRLIATFGLWRPLAFGISSIPEHKSGCPRDRLSRSGELSEFPIGIGVPPCKSVHKIGTFFDRYLF